MADSPSQIDTSGNLDGARQLAEQLELDIPQIKALGESCDELKGKLQDVNDAAADAAEKVQGAGEGLKIFGHDAQGAKTVLDELNGVFPGLSQFTRFLQSGFTAAIAVAVLAYEYFKERIEQLNSALDKLTIIGARSDWLERQREIVDQSTVSYAVFEHQLRAAASAADVLQQSTERLIASAQQQINAQTQIAEAQKSLEEARVDLAEKLGQISHEDAIKIKLQLDEAGFKQQAEAKTKEIEAEINARTSELSHATQQAPALEGKVKQTTEAAKAAALAKARNDSKLKQDRDSLQQTENAEAENQRRIDELEAKKGTWLGKIDKASSWELDMRKGLSEQNQNVMAGYRHSIQQEEGKKAGLDARAETTNQDAEDARKENSEVKKEMVDARKQIQQLQNDLVAEKAKATALKQLHNQTAETRAAGDILGASASGTPLPELIGQVRTGVGHPRQHVQSGHGNSSELAVLFNEVIALTRDVHTNAAQRTELGELRNQIEALRRDVEIHGQRLNASLNVS